MSAPSTDIRHTPGPWIVEATGPRKRKPPTLVMVVAERGGMPGLIVSQGSVEERDIANARLIAAAPDLLSMLQELRQMALDDAALFSDESLAKPFYIVSAEKIDAVIRKATNGK